MKKLALLTLFVLPIFFSTALAMPASQGERLVKAIFYLGSQLPEINVVSPGHVPAPAASGGIGPGSPLLIEMPGVIGLCTANFVWTSNGKTKNYLGAAGHCFLPPGTNSTHGLGTDYDPALSTAYVCISRCDFGGISALSAAAVGLRSLVGDWVQLGSVPYARQTWNTVGVGDDPVGNDFGIVEIPRDLESLIRPSMPVWGGPSTVEDVGDGGLCLFGNAVGFGEIFVTKARAGKGAGLDEDQRSWKAFLPSFQGDSGSAIVTCGQHADSIGLHGQGAAGILTHISAGTEAVQIVGTTVRQAVQMVQRDAGIGLGVMLEGGTSVKPTATSLQSPSLDVPAGETVNNLELNGMYEWNSEFAMGFSLPGVLAPAGVFVDDPCATQDGSDACDYEFINVAVPKDGANLIVEITPLDPKADFSLYIYAPDGYFVGSSTNNPFASEAVTAHVTQPGVYTIGVKANVAVSSSYSGSAKLEAPPPPPIPHFDGEISRGDSYSWTGDPPSDASPFTCAAIGFGFVDATCDNEFIKINVPNRGSATLTVDIVADTNGEDFDLYIYTPSSGEQLRFEGVGDEHAVLTVTESGVYRFGVVGRSGVDPLAGQLQGPALGTYNGLASLK